MTNPNLHYISILCQRNLLTIRKFEFYDTWMAGIYSRETKLRLYMHTLKLNPFDIKRITAEAGSDFVVGKVYECIWTTSVTCNVTNVT